LGPLGKEPRQANHPKLAIDVAGSGESVTLALRGEIDVSTAALLEEALDMEVVREATRVTLDLAKCAFADSVGLAVVMRMALGLGERGGELILRSPTGQLRRLFQVTGALEKLPNVVVESQ
jgi:anti-anti-sigma factor